MDTRKGPHWLPGSPTPPGQCRHCGGPLKGQSICRVISHLWPQEASELQTPALVYTPRPWPTSAVNPASFPVILDVSPGSITVFQAPWTCQSQHLRERPPAIPPGSFLLSAGLTVLGLRASGLTVLLPRMLKVPGKTSTSGGQWTKSLRPILARGLSLVPLRSLGPALLVSGPGCAEQPLRPFWPTWTVHLPVCCGRKAAQLP